MAVISKPKLPGLSDRQPDFMWIATDSVALYPILIEIETPQKKWFYVSIHGVILQSGEVFQLPDYL